MSVLTPYWKNSDFNKILTDEEAVGYGESLFAPGLMALIAEFKPLVIGREISEIHPIGRTPQTAGVAARLLGGIVNNAIAGIESALWELLGQSLGVPMYKLFGDGYRTAIRLYADCHAGEGLSSLSAEIFSAVMVPHNISSPIGTLASAHLCAALPNFLVLEHHGLEVPFWEDLARGWEGFSIKDGYIQLDPGKPGLGIELNEAEAYKYRKREEPFFDQAPDKN